MTIVTAIMKPFKLDEARDALPALGVHGLTVTAVKGYGRQKGRAEICRGAEIGDGKIFVTPIEQALRIRTDQSDNDAL